MDSIPTDSQARSFTADGEALSLFTERAPDDYALLDAAMLREQIHLLTDRRIDLPINMVLAILVSVTVWHRYPAWLVSLWCGVFAVVILFRMIARRRFRRNKYDAVAMRGWGLVFAWSAVATGCLWGLTSSVVLVAADPMLSLFIVFVLAGMMTGGIVCNSAYLPAMFGFVLPILLPMIGVLVLAGEMLHYEMAGMVLMLTLVLVRAGRDINQSIVTNVRLRVGQTALFDQLRASEMAMAEVQRIAQVGGIELNRANDSILCTDEEFRILGVDERTFERTFGALMERIHPDDRSAVSKAFANFLKTGAPNESDYRAVMDDGSVKYLHSVGQVMDTKKGRAARFFATVQDVTVRKIAEEKLQFANTLLRTQMEASPDGVAVVNVHRKIISYNRLFAEIWKIPIEKLDTCEDDYVFSVLSKTQKDPQEFRDRVRDLYDHPGRDGYDELETLDGRFIDRHSKTLLTPTQEYLGRVWFFRDVTERKRANEELIYRDRLLHAVTVGASILVKAVSPEKGMPDALRIVCESMRVTRGVVMEEEDDGLLTLRYSWQEAGSPEPVGRDSPRLHSADSVALAAWRSPLREGKPVIGQLQTAEGAVREMLEWLHSQSTLLVPIFIGDKLWGTLAVDSITMVRNWTITEIETLKAFGDIAGAIMVHHEAGVALERSEERFRVLGATAADAIIITDGKGRISSWNIAAERILGYTASEAIGQEAHALLAPAGSRPAADEGVKAFHLTGRGDVVGKTRELVALRKDGTEVAIELSLAGALIGSEWQAIGILRDITERKAAEKKLQFANILLTTEMEASPDGILVVDTKRKVISSNKRFEEIWKIPHATLVAGEDTRVLSSGEATVKNPQQFSELVERLYQHPPSVSDDAFEMMDGRSIERHTVPLTTDSGVYLGRIWFFRDVTERVEGAAHTLRMARFDVLTGLANRSVFVEAVDVATARAKRGGPGFAVIYLDLDHFKDVNDTMGHPIGDGLLQAVAVRLRTNTRELDTVARFGGDEFAVVVADVEEPADAAAVAEKLIAALGAPYVIQGNQIYSSASIGVDIYGPEVEDAELLLSHADVALYRAKSAGRSSYRFFTESMDREVRTQVSLGTELHEALDKEQFFLEYQPQVAIATSRLVGVEALVRWHHPVRGILGPDVFIPIAEKSGLIVRLGQWVLMTACRQMRLWIDAGFDPFRVAVNVSAVQFKSSVSLEANILNVLHVTGLSPRWLELELTETVLMKATTEHSDIMIRLRKLGITIAIDDFGTGFSSLAYLRRFPVDRIKIAQNFVSHLGSEPGDASIVRATIGLSRELGKSLIAEGVETQEQLALLTEWGCKEIQGYYYSRPISAAAITRVLAAGGTLGPGAAALTLVQGAASPAP